MHCTICVLDTQIHAATFVIVRGNKCENNFDIMKFQICAVFYYNNNNNNIYLLQLGCHPVAVVILHVNKT